MKNIVPVKASRAAARIALKAQKHSPGLLFGAGLVGFGATVVLASVATLKLDDELKETQKTLLDAEQHFTGKQLTRTKAHILVDSGYHIVKMYGPAILCGSVTVVCLTKSHNIMTKRNAALTIAYTGMDKAFREYRERVREQYGEETERDLFHSAQDVHLVEDTDKGPKKVTARRHGDRSLSPYAVLFDESNPNWQQSPEFRFLTLKSKQTFMNKRLDRKGVVLLNDVYDELDIPRTPAGSRVGWNRDTSPDGFIDFGFEDPERQDVFLDFVLGREGAIWLDFNVDGEVWQDI